MDNDEKFSPKYLGKHKGFVRDNRDPEGRGCLRLYVPQVMGAESDNPNGWTGWADPCLPWLGGFSTLDFGVPPTAKEAGEEVGVWVEFEGGNPDFPIWTGCFIVAPVRDGRRSQTDPQELAADTPGGSLVSSPPPGASVGAINPVTRRVGSKELSLWAKEGREIVIGSKNGGAIIIGPYGVDFTGPFVRANGRAIEATPENMTG